MKMNSKAIVAAAAALAAGAASATEGGGSIYPVGAENFTCCAVPPPGFYGLTYFESYSANKLRGDDGQVVTPPSFKADATAIVERLIWVTPVTVGSASLALHTIIPVVDLDVKVVPGVGAHTTGVGDIVVGAALAWHHSANLHTMVALDIYAPTGSYDKTAVASIGRNYWAFQPVFGISYIDPAGPNADAKVMWTYNLENDATHYKSGQEFIVDYSLGWGLGNGWTLGAGGYLYQQVNDDKLEGADVANNKGRSFAIGPALKYDSGKGWFVTAKFQAETQVRNRLDGHAFWLKAVYPF